MNDALRSYYDDLLDNIRAVSRSQYLLLLFYVVVLAVVSTAYFSLWTPLAKSRDECLRLIDKARKTFTRSYSESERQQLPVFLAAAPGKVVHQANILRAAYHEALHGRDSTQATIGQVFFYFRSAEALLLDRDGAMDMFRADLRTLRNPVNRKIHIGALNDLAHLPLNDGLYNALVGQEQDIFDASRARLEAQPGATVGTLADDASAYVDKARLRWQQVQAASPLLDLGYPYYEASQMIPLALVERHTQAEGALVEQIWQLANVQHSWRDATAQEPSRLAPIMQGLDQIEAYVRAQKDAARDSSEVWQASIREVTVRLPTSLVLSLMPFLCLLLVLVDRQQTRLLAVLSRSRQRIAEHWRRESAIDLPPIPQGEAAYTRPSRLRLSIGVCGAWMAMLAVGNLVRRGLIAFPAGWVTDVLIAGAWVAANMLVVSRWLRASLLRAVQLRSGHNLSGGA